MELIKLYWIQRLHVREVSHDEAVRLLEENICELNAAKQVLENKLHEVFSGSKGDF